jgi:LPS-assembly lipoprotein
MPTRRAALVAAAVACATAAALVVGCGFELRRAPELQFRTIQLTGFKPRSPLADELRMNIDASPGTRVVATLPQAQIVLEAVADERLKLVVASGSAGQVNEFQLRSRFTFRVRSVAGKELIPSTEILLTRNMSYTEQAELGKQYEAEFLYRAMQSDIVAQVLRRLASVQTF